MNPFRILTRTFIDVFGITHPTPQQEKRATWFICILLTLVVVGAVLAFFVFYNLMHR